MQIMEKKGTYFSLEVLERKKKAEPRIGILRFNLLHEKVNKLSEEVMKELEVILEKISHHDFHDSQDSIDALILCSGKPENFIAGADLESILKIKTQQEAEALVRRGQKLLDAWEDLKFPTIAAVKGAALGGGCEFALACSAIVMSNDSFSSIGLPEVRLGLMPGMGGTVRLPRKIGLLPALDLILSGKTINAKKATQIGIVEAVLPKENFEDSVCRWVVHHFKVLKNKKKPRIQILEKKPFRYFILKKIKKQILLQTKGHYPAPLQALESIQATFSGSGNKYKGKKREQALCYEAKNFAKLVVNGISRHLINLFFLTTHLKKWEILFPQIKVQAFAIKRAAVVGAGVMGGGIVQLFADHRIPTRMKDVSPFALSFGIENVVELFKKQVKKKIITQRQFLQKLNFIAPVTLFIGFRSVDLVVEAIVEDLEIKKKTLQELENFVRTDCILATNTSSLSVSQMQSCLKQQERFIGMHFFNPVSKMPLIELIRGQKTSDQTIASVFEFCKHLGKIPIVVKDSPGFLVNRILAPYLNEATYLVDAGVSILRMDQVLIQFGMPMGPLELLDEVGIDIVAKISHILNQAFGDRLKPCKLNEIMIATGRKGKKNGKGFYLYGRNEKKVPQKRKFNETIYTELGIKQSQSEESKISDEEILQRCLFPMINEAARCMQEGVVSSASEVDIAMVTGIGFPAFRGGLLRYADSIGILKIIEGLKKYEAKWGSRFSVSSAMLNKAESLGIGLGEKKIIPIFYDVS